MGDGRTNDDGSTTGTNGGGGTAGAPQGTNNDGQGQQGTGETRTFTQADLDRIVADRLAREKAKFADYDEAKAKAAELDKLRESEKSDLEKLQGTPEEILGELSRTQNELRISRAITKHNLSPEDAEFLSGETDEEVEAKAAKLAARTNAAGNGGGTNDNTGDGTTGGRRPDPSQGHGSSGDGASSVAAGRQRYRDRHGSTN